MFWVFFSLAKADRALKLFLVCWLQSLLCFLYLRKFYFIYATPSMHWKYGILDGNIKVSSEPGPWRVHGLVEKQTYIPVIWYLSYRKEIITISSLWSTSYSFRIPWGSAVFPSLQCYWFLSYRYFQESDLDKKMEGPVCSTLLYRICYRCFSLKINSSVTEGLKEEKTLHSYNKSWNSSW